MSQKHLSTGSTNPPKVEGKLRLYSMEYCPYAQRPRLVLKAKNIPHDIVNINLRHKPEWYFKIHPEGKVPALDTGSEIIVESLVICDYLDEKYPNPPLYPKDEATKKRDKELIQSIDKVTGSFYGLLLKKDSKTLDEWIKQILSDLEIFENELKKRGTKYFGGDKPGMLDYMLWPWAERAKIIPVIVDKTLSLKENDIPLLKQWAKNMIEDPVCKETINPTKRHVEIALAKIKNEDVNYD